MTTSLHAFLCHLSHIILRKPIIDNNRRDNSYLRQLLPAYFFQQGQLSPPRDNAYLEQNTILHLS